MKRVPVSVFRNEFIQTILDKGKTVENVEEMKSLIVRVGKEVKVNQQWLKAIRPLLWKSSNLHPKIIKYLSQLNVYWGKKWILKGILKKNA